MKISAWGNYPKIEANVFNLKNIDNLKNFILDKDELIAYGNGRSYGDSALSKNIIQTKNYNYFLDFDKENGILEVQSGVLLSEILDLIVPNGYFLKVTPGTKLITVGGAIASDIHGKNHHMQGCFSECVEEITLFCNNEIKKVKKDDELFLATCGGMGLTGIILSAKISLKKINSSFIKQTTIKTKNLNETFEAFEQNANSPYSVAWIDCLANDKEIGKSLLMVGDFLDDNNLEVPKKKKLSIPFDFPTFTLNKFSVKTFNYLYYNKVKDSLSTQIVDYETFFYPLDSISNWNKIYGKNGFTQYQFILPKESSFEGLKKILKTISFSGKGSFLAVLKLYGKENKNYLSFPIEGYSLALDFKIEKDTFKLLNKLDEIVLKYGGRIYLTKDVRVSKEIFEKGYPKINLFRELRKDLKLNKIYNSLQSKRVKI